MRPSAIVEPTLGGFVLLPLKQSSDDRRRLNEILHLIHPITWLYVSFFFSATRLASLFIVTVASGAIPPLVVKTKGVKHPCSISRTRLPYSAFFFLSCSRYTVDRGFWEYDDAKG